MRMAPSMSAAFRSGILVSAMVRSCSRVTVPTFCFFDEAEPLSSPAAFFSRIAAGGVLVMKVKERSPYTVISTGMIIPGWPWVRALNCLQNSMMFTPCWPSAGPTGGAGLAAPAGTWSLMKPVTFFAMSRPRIVLSPRCRPPRGGSEAAELRVVELERGGAPEEADLHLHLPLLVV